MKRLLRGAVVLAGSLTLAGGAALAAAGPAAAQTHHLVPDNFAYGSYAPSGAISGCATCGPNDLAVAPPADTEVANNVNINGLLFTGTTYDTAGTSSAYSKVWNVSAPSTLGSALTWTSGPDSYSFTLSSSLVNAYCNSSGTTTTTINSGRLTEDSWVTKTGVSISHQVFNLPQLPAVGQTYNFNGGTVVLNTQNTVGAVTEVIGITVTTGAGTPQVLEVAVAGCESGGGPDGVANGDFTKGLSNWSPFVTGAGSATVSTGAGDEGENVANLTGGSPAGTESLSQQFIADGNFLTFDYKQTCGSGAGALTIVLNDATTGVNANLVGPARCTTDANWQSQFSFLTPGDTYTLTVTNSNTTGNITTTLFGDVRVGLF